MSRFRTPQLSLRAHSLLISAALLLLTAFLAWKVLSNARNQAEQMNALIHGDFRAQALLQTIEAKQDALKSINRKYWVTRDPNYAALVAQETDELSELRRALLGAVRIAHPEITEADVEDVIALKRRLDVLLSASLAERERDAAGISKYVLFALGLSITISLWVSDLFFRRLGRPLLRLKNANSQLARGNLEFRIAECPRAVLELSELSDSFNRMASRLQELDRTKYQFFSEVSHQVKNPLAALKEGLDLISRSGEELSDLARKKAVGACSISTKRLEAMIENLMQHARIERGFRDFKLEYADLGELIEAAVTQLQPLADKGRITLSTAITRPLAGTISSEGMTHVIENLLMNAIRYSEENSTVQIQAHRVMDDSFALKVTNRSKYALTCDPSRLFERFFRGNPVEQPGGFGLGLYIVKSIIDAHQGSVRALFNSKDKLFTVQLEIPVSKAVV